MSHWVGSGKWSVFCWAYLCKESATSAPPVGFSVKLLCIHFSQFRSQSANTLCEEGLEAGSCSSGGTGNTTSSGFASVTGPSSVAIILCPANTQSLNRLLHSYKMQYYLDKLAYNLLPPLITYCSFCRELCAGFHCTFHDLLQIIHRHGVNIVERIGHGLVQFAQLVTALLLQCGSSQVVHTVRWFL